MARIIPGHVISAKKGGAAGEGEEKEKKFPGLCHLSIRSPGSFFKVDRQFSGTDLPAPPLHFPACRVLLLRERKKSWPVERVFVRGSRKDLWRATGQLKE